MYSDKKKFITTPLQVGATCVLLMITNGCATMQDTWDKHGGKIVGAVAGAAVGAIACKGDKDCIAKGAVAGFALGWLWDRRQRQLEELARKENLALDVNRVKTYNNSTSSNNGLEVAVKNDGMFQSGSYVLTVEAERKFRLLAQIYREDTKKILIMGHTDAVGSEQFNQRLSEKRARYVANLFAEEGVSRQNIFYQGSGESQPVASNAYPESRAKNRRVEVLEVDSEASLAAYSLGRKSDSKYLVHSTKTDRELAVINKRQDDAKKPDSSESVPATQNIERRELLKPKHMLVDFGGVPAGPDTEALLAKAGGKKVEGINFSLIRKAHANEPFNLSPCYMDAPRITGVIKSLSDDRELDLSQYTLTDYMPGMSGTVWLDQVNDHLVAMKNIRVLRNSGTPVGNPNVMVYTNYDGNKGKADFEKRAVVDTYRGTKGLLYRAYFSGKFPLKCMDIVLPYKKPFEAMAGALYYETSIGIYTKDYKPRQIIKRR